MLVFLSPYAYSTREAVYNKWAEGGGKGFSRLLRVKTFSEKRVVRDFDDYVQHLTAIRSQRKNYRIIDVAVQL